jgi:hypothetical protein
MSGGGRAVASWSLRLGSVMPQPPPSCSSETTQCSFLLVPGIGMSIERMFWRTHCSSSVSFGTQTLSKRVGS